VAVVPGGAAAVSFFFLPYAEAPTFIWNLADAVRKT